MTSRELENIAKLLFDAIEVLTTHPGSLQARLFLSYQTCLTHVAMRRQTLPDDVRELFENIADSMSKVEPTDDEGHVTATMRSISNLEARRIVQRIIELLERVLWAVAEQSRVEGRGAVLHIYMPSVN
jgi:hypothetical protein